MTVTTAKKKNADPNTGSRCRPGRNLGWLRPGSACALLFLGLAVFPAAPAHAAIALDDVNSFGAQLCDPCEWTHTVTTGGTDRILVVAVTGETKSDQSIVSVTYNGLALTQIRQDVHSSLDFRTSLWYRLDPPTGTAHTISVDWDAAPDKFIGGSLSFTGVSQTDPIDDTSNLGFGATGASTSATIDVVTENADAWIVDATATHDDITMVAKTGRVEQWNINPGGPINGAGSTLDTTGQGTGTYTLDWTIGSLQEWAISSAALKANTSTPSIAKAFAPNGMVSGGTSTITFTLNNPTAGLLTGASFTDTYPATMVNTTGLVVGGTCANVTHTAVAGGGTFNLTAGDIPAAGSCTVTVDVTATASGTNNTSVLSTTEAPDSATGGSDTLTINTAPSITKAFAPDPILSGGTSTITFTLTNPNAGLLTGASFTDTYPATMVNTTGLVVGGTCANVTHTAVAGGGTFNLTAGDIPAAGSCTVTVDVTATATGTNTTSVLSTNEAPDSATGGSDTLTITPSITKAFAPSGIASGGTSTITFTLGNPTAGLLTGASFTDTYPATMVNETALVVGGTCANVTHTAVAGGGTFNLTAGDIPASGSCTVTVDVTATATGINTTSVLSTNEAPDSASGGSDTLTIGSPPVANDDIASTPVDTATTINVLANDTDPDSDPLTITLVDSPTTQGGTASINNNGTPGDPSDDFIDYTPPAAFSGTDTFTYTIDDGTGGTDTATVTALMNVCPGGSVTTTTDSATGGSLRACVIWANANPGTDTLTVPAGTYTLTISGTGEDAAATGDLDITEDIVINGNAASATIIDANTIDRVFDLFGADLTASNLTIRNGDPGGKNGGGILLDDTASLTLSDSTVSGNTTTKEGGGIYADGGSVALTNVTISGNTADTGGGTVCVGPCTLTNVTVTLNTGTTDAGGLRQKSGAGSITFLNTIVANNSSVGNDDCKGGASQLISNGYNLSSDDTCDFTNTGDLENTDPLLGPLQDNGGPTFTHALLTGSPAIDAGTNTGCPATDQRGSTRPVGSNCDIGAYEAEPPVPSITKAFFSNPIATGATSTITFTLTNPTAGVLTGASFTDTYPATMVNTTGLVVGGTCANVTHTAVAGGGSFDVTTGDIPAAASCTITVNVTATASGTNTTSVLSTNEEPDSATGGSATLTVDTAPSIAKAFSPNSMVSGGTSTITFTLTNPNAGLLTGASFTDTYPATMVNTTGLVVGGTCANVTHTAVAAGGTFNLTAGDIPGSGSCTVTVDVTATATGTNNTSVLSTNEEPDSATGGSDTLTINVAPSISKVFGTDPIASGGTSTITFTLTNPNAGLLTGANFTDAYPAGMVNTTGLVVGGTCANVTHTAVAAGGTFNLTAGDIPGSGSCTVTVDVTATASGTNTTSVLSTNEAPDSATGGSDTLTVNAAPTITKAFGTDPIASGGTSTITFTLTNPNVGLLTGANFTDAYPATMVNTSPLVTGGTCANVLITASAGGASFDVTAGDIPGAGSCTITVDVTATATGTNTTSVLSTNEAPDSAAGGSATLTVDVAACQGFNDPGANAARAGEAVTNPGNAHVADDTYAQFKDAAEHDYETYGFTIAAGSTIVGVEVRVEWHTTQVTDTGFLTIQLLDAAGNQVGTSKTTPTIDGTTDVTHLLGGPSDTWGASLTDSIVNDVDFGVSILYTKTAGGGGNNAFLDNVDITVCPESLPTLTKAFAPNPIISGATSTITFNLTNPTAGILTGASFTDAYPAGMTNTTPLVTGGTCANVVTTAVAGGSSFDVTAGDIPASSSCTITVDVTATATGTNTTSVLSTTEEPDSATVGSATLTVDIAPTLTQAFAPSSIAFGGASTITFTLTSAYAGLLTGASFTDAYPAGMTNTSPLVTGGTCANMVTTAVAGGTSFDVTAGDIPASSSCTITVDVTATATGTNITSVLSTNEVQDSATGGSATLTVAPPAIDHFAIVHDGSGINCQAESVTIEAHGTGHVLATGYTGIVSLSISTTRGDWSLISGSGILDNVTADDGAATYDFDPADGGSAVLGFSDTYVETININLIDGATVEDPTEDANLVFARAGFNFLANSSKNAIALQIAGKPSDVSPGVQTLELQAVNTDDDTGACEAALTGVNSVDLAFECEDPLTCTASTLNINGSNISGTNSGAGLNYTGVNLDFGDASDTTATFVMNYPDAGLIQLHARDTLSPSGETMLGTSNEFVVRPFAFHVSATGNPAATGPAGVVFTSSGTNFTANVRAVIWAAGDDTDSNGIADNHNDTNPANNADLSDNAAALNYGQESSAEQVSLSSTLDQPAAGSDPGLSGGTTISAFTAGSGTSSTARYDEVGIIELRAVVADGVYLGIGALATADMLARSGYVGRFNPARYAVQAGSENVCEGSNDPGGNAARAGTPVETPANAYVSNDAYAVFRDTSHHDYNTYGFTLPGGTTITGVEIHVEWHGRKPWDYGYLTLQLLDASGNLIGATKTTPIIAGDTPDVTHVLGGPDDSWGAALSATIVNDVDFGVSLLYTKTAGGGGNRAYVDNVDIRLCSSGEGSAPEIIPACGNTFTYSRQPFTGSLVLEAQNGTAGGNLVTQNYRAGFVTLDLATEMLFVNDQTSTAYDAETITYTEDFDSGLTGKATLALQFRWDMPVQAPAVSMVQLTGITDEVTTLAAAPVDIGSTPMRYGRVAIGSALGSELVNLAVPMRVQYFVDASTDFVTDTGDTCSSDLTLSFSNFAGNLNSGETCVLDTGSPGDSGAGCAAAGPVPQRYDEPQITGDFNLFLQASGAGNDGSVSVGADVPAWLKFDWDTGVPGDENPSGLATFGIYTGDDSQVYRRELY